MSGIHFSHYKAQTKSCFLATIRCRLINIAIRNRSSLARWLNGLSLMLEKSKGNIQVEKLRALLLLEADLNAIYKIMFNGRVLPSIEEKKRNSN